MFASYCNVKIHATGFNKLLEGIFCTLLVVEAFSLQTAVKMLVGWWLVGESQVNMVDEAKVHRPARSASEALGVPSVVGCCCGGELASLLTHAGCRHCSCHQLAGHTSQT